MSTEKNAGFDAERYADLVGFNTDWRDTWWNQDYLELLARRLDFKSARTMLDVGCGAGHWGQRLTTVMDDGVHVTGTDHEAGFLDAARTRAEGRPHTFKYSVGDGNGLLFADGQFDMVTCQTVLMHVPNAASMVAEMIRVLKPGGLILCAEPNNMFNGLSDRLATPGMTHETIDRLFKFEHRIIRGRVAVGQGDPTIGERLPGIFARAGLANIRVASNDRCGTMLPPYDTPAQKLNFDMMASWLDKEMFAWGDRETVRPIHSAGGGDDADFDELFDLGIATHRAQLEALKAGTYFGAGGFTFYVVSGRKPLA